MLNEGIIASLCKEAGIFEPQCYRFEDGIFLRGKFLEQKSCLDNTGTTFPTGSKRKRLKKIAGKFVN